MRNFINSSNFKNKIIQKFDPGWSMVNIDVPNLTKVDNSSLSRLQGLIFNSTDSKDRSSYSSIHHMDRSSCSMG